MMAKRDLLTGLRYGGGERIATREYQSIPGLQPIINGWILFLKICVLFYRSIGGYKVRKTGALTIG